MRNFVVPADNTCAVQAFKEALPVLRSNSNRWKGPSWRKFSTSRLDEPQVRTFMSSFSSRIEALAAWATLEAIFNFLLRNLISWEEESLALTLPAEEWLEAVRLGPGDLDFFEKVLSCAQKAGLLSFKRENEKILISAPETVKDADEYTKRLLRKTQANQQEGRNKRETTRTRLARLEEQVAKLTETVTRLVDALQGQGQTSSSSVPAPEGEPPEKEKAQILEEFKEKFLLETDDWRKAVILLSFPPREQIGPGYLARMTDLSQAGQALARWREAKKTQTRTLEEVKKLEEAKVFARMVQDGFDFSQVPGEIVPLVQKILKSGGNGHVRA